MENERDSILSQASGEPSALGYLVGFASLLVMLPIKIAYDSMWGPDNQTLTSLVGVYDFTCSPDGQKIAILLNTAQKNRLLIFDRPTQKRTEILDYSDRNESINAFHFISKSEVLVVTNASIEIWDLINKKGLVVEKFAHNIIYPGEVNYHAATATLAVSSPSPEDSNSNLIKIYRLELAEKTVRQISEVKNASISAFSEGGDKIAILYRGEISIYNTIDAKKLKSFPLDPSSGVSRLQWLGGDHLLVDVRSLLSSSDLSERLQLWDLRTEKKMAAFSARLSPRFVLADKTGKRIFVGPYSQTESLQLHVLDSNNFGQVIDKIELSRSGNLQKCRLGSDDSELVCLFSKNGVLDQSNFLSFQTIPTD